jgi:hypothetical protein
MLIFDLQSWPTTDWNKSRMGKEFPGHYFEIILSYARCLSKKCLPNWIRSVYLLQQFQNQGYTALICFPAAWCLIAVHAVKMSSESNGAIPRKWTAYFRPVAPGGTAVPPPAGLALWSSQTGHATLFGFLLGGISGLRAARAAPPAKAASEGFVNARHRVATYFVREGVLLGARTGAFVALLSGSALIIEGIRGVSHPLNFSCAGALTCGLFGGAIGGWRAAAGSGLFGAASGGVLAVAHNKLYDVARLYGLDVTPFDVITASPGLKIKPAYQIEMENVASGQELIQSTVSWLENTQQKRLCDDSASDRSPASPTTDRESSG